mmetsp:Transcript_46688/g.113772  ORF Transcript_46688/g.113772 Transcript_46688/m.113772 type:complete len:207 (-) Transcript_46688:795-1415(-)
MRGNNTQRSSDADATSHRNDLVTICGSFEGRRHWATNPESPMHGLMNGGMQCFGPVTRYCNHEYHVVCISRILKHGKRVPFKFTDPWSTQVTVSTFAMKTPWFCKPNHYSAFHSDKFGRLNQIRRSHQSVQPIQEINSQRYTSKISNISCWRMCSQQDHPQPTEIVCTFPQFVWNLRLKIHQSHRPHNDGRQNQGNETCPSRLVAK